MAEKMDEGSSQNPLDTAAVLEALLFLSPDPLSVERAAEVLEGVPWETIQEGFRALQDQYETSRGLQIIEVAGGYRLCTREQVALWVQRFYRTKPARLSRAALETLAIIAYKQPITKAEVEVIRGVSIDGILRALLERDLIRILGRKAEVGRPILYGTSRKFLEYFGLRDITDLPTLREIDEMVDTAESTAREPVRGMPPAPEELEAPVSPSPA